MHATQLKERRASTKKPPEERPSHLQHHFVIVVVPDPPASAATRGRFNLTDHKADLAAASQRVFVFGSRTMQIEDCRAQAYSCALGLRPHTDMSSTDC